MHLRYPVRYLGTVCLCVLVISVVVHFSNTSDALTTIAPRASVAVETTGNGYAVGGEDAAYYLKAGAEVSVRIHANVPLADTATITFFIDRDGDSATTNDRERVSHRNRGRVEKIGINSYLFRVLAGDNGYLFYQVSDITDAEGTSFEPIEYAGQLYYIDTDTPYIIGSDVRVFRDGVLIEDGVIQVGDDIHVHVETSEPVASVQAFSPFLLFQDRVLVSGGVSSINAAYTYIKEDVGHIGGGDFIFHIKGAQDLAGNQAEGVSEEVPYVVLVAPQVMAFETASAYLKRAGLPEEGKEEKPRPLPPPAVIGGVRHLITIRNATFAPVFAPNGQ